MDSEQLAVQQVPSRYCQSLAPALLLRMLGPRPRPLEIAGAFFFLFNFYKNSFQAPYFDHILFPPLIPNSSQIPTCPTHVLSSHLPQSHSEIQLKIKTGKQLLKKQTKQNHTENHGVHSVLANHS